MTLCPLSLWGSWGHLQPHCQLVGWVSTLQRSMCCVPSNRSLNILTGNTLSFLQTPHLFTHGERPKKLGKGVAFTLSLSGDQLARRLRLACLSHSKADHSLFGCPGWSLGYFRNQKPNRNPLDTLRFSETPTKRRSPRTYPLSHDSSN